jgi:regulator of RNase E activity RraA
MKSSKEEKAAAHPTEKKRISTSIISQFMQLEDLTSSISDVLDSLGIWGAIPATTLKPILENKKIVGPALTIRHISENADPSKLMAEGKKSRLKMLNMIPMIQPGDVIVVDGGARFDVSSQGELGAFLMKQNGAIGSIVDSGIRDLASLRKLDFPVWSRGVTPITGKLRFDTVEINGVITCAGIPVRPGDLIVADDTGVTIIPYERVEEVLKKTIELCKSEEKLLEAFKEKKSLEELGKIVPIDKW